MVFHQSNRNPTKIDGIIVWRYHGLYGGITVFNGGIIVFMKVSLCMVLSLYEGITDHMEVIIFCMEVTMELLLFA